MSDEHEYEEEFGAALRQVLADSPEPVVELLAAGAHARGRRKKLRRNLLAGTAAVAVVAGATLGATTLHGGAGRHAQAGNPASTVVGTPGSPSTGPAGPASPAAVPAPVTADQMLALLKERVPAGFQTGGSMEQGAVNDPKIKADGPFALIELTDGQGQGNASINVRVFPNPLNLDLPGLVCQTDQNPADSCNRVKLADNSYLRTIKRTDEFKGSTIHSWSVDLERPDGLVVTAGSSDEAPGGAKAGRPVPPLSTDQLASLVQDKAWQGVTTGVKSGISDIDPEAAAFRNVPLHQILSTAAPLLPNGLTELTPTGEDSFASFLVNDGHGSALVRVTVEDWSTFQPGRFSGGDITDEFTDATTRPDGSKLIASHQDPFYPAYHGVVCNSAKVLTPGKLMITVESFNSTDFKSGVTRPQPPLTLDQVTAIALSPTWRGPAG